MKTSYLLVGLVAIIIGGFVLFLSSSTDYVANVNQEVIELEAELADIEAQVENGTLTPEEAAKAQISIAKRLDAISDSVQGGQRAQLTNAQKIQLNEGLERLKKVLVAYQGTLSAVDTQVETLPVASRPQLNRGGGSRTITQAVVETVAEAEEILQEILEDYDETPIEELFEEEISDVEGDSEESESAIDDEVEEGSSEIDSDSGDTETGGGDETTDDSDVSSEEEQSTESGFVSDVAADEDDVTNP